MKKFFLSLLLLSLQVTLEALPAQVLIIRHAEKPPKGDFLSLKGRERSAAYMPYFTENPELLNHGLPAAIYAPSPSRDNPSRRSLETVEPLAEALDLVINDKYVHDDYKNMVEEIKRDPSYNGKNILIVWEHHAIPEIARALGALQTPAKWPGEVYDRTWVITFEPTGKALFQNLPQRLMYGDTTN